MMKIGLLGGSFNPPHQGHIHISELAIKKLGLSQLWWIPNKSNPLKKRVIFEDFGSRFKKCQQITTNHPKIRVKDFGEKTLYTVELLKKLKLQYPGQQFYFVMGADNLTNFHYWKKFKKLIKLVVFAIFGREKFLLSYQNTKAYQIYQGFLKNNLNKGKGAKICGKNLPQLLIFRTKNMNISSTQIRTKNV